MVVWHEKAFWYAGEYKGFGHWEQKKPGGLAGVSSADCIFRICRNPLTGHVKTKRSIVFSSILSRKKHS
jgi:hypothetical protein